MPPFHLPPFATIAGRDDLPAHATEFLPPSASLVLTPELSDLLVGAAIALRSRRIVVVDGQPGCGKTTAKQVVAACSPVRTAVFSVTTNRHSPGLEFMERAHAAVLGIDAPEMSERKHRKALAHLLTVEPLLLLIDEAQNAPLEVLRNLRSIMELPNAKFGVALFGTGVADNLKREQMLKTWVGYTATFRPMLTPNQVATAPKQKQQEYARRAQLLPVLDELHPRLAATDRRLLIETNRVFAHGLLRNWVVVLEWLLALSPGTGAFGRQDFIDAITAIVSTPPAFAA